MRRTRRDSMMWALSSPMTWRSRRARSTSHQQQKPSCSANLVHADVLGETTRARAAAGRNSSGVATGWSDEASVGVVVVAGRTRRCSRPATRPMACCAIRQSRVSRLLSFIVRRGDGECWMATYWCANFDGNVSVLRYGIAERLWLMQYQYSHNGHAFQGTPEQIASTSKNWNAAGEVKPGDWLVAYLPSNRFYAVGQVIKPRHRERHRGGARHRDTIARTIREHQHLFLNGVVHYTEASAFYEDFTDNWRRSTINYYSKE